MSAPYNNDTLARATQYVNNINANMGGTEILAPLQKILETPAYDRYPRQIMLLTDGEVSNTQQIVDYVKKHCSTTRVFTFGIGADVSKYLIKEVARAGNGKFEFVGANERLEEKVGNQLQMAITPGLTKLRLDWGTAQAEQAPSKLKVLFTGTLLLVYGFLKQVSNNFEVQLHAESAHGPLTFKIPVNVGNQLQLPVSNFIHRLGARALITELVDRDPNDANNKKTIIGLGLKYSLVSRFTSFVAVEKRTEGTDGTMQLREIPVVFEKESPKPSGGFGFGITTTSNNRFLIGSSAPTNSISFGSTPSTGGFGFGSSVPQSSNFAFGAPPPSTAPNPFATPSGFGGSSSGFGTSTGFGSAPQPQLFSSYSTPAPSFAYAPVSPTIRPPSEPQPNPMNKITALISLQNADGTWNLTPNFASVIGVSLQQIVDAMKSSKLNSSSDVQTAWATSLALAFLETFFSTTLIWKISGDKAKKWISSNASPGGKDGWIPWVTSATDIMKSWNLKPI